MLWVENLLLSVHIIVRQYNEAILCTNMRCVRVFSRAIVGVF